MPRSHSFTVKYSGGVARVLRTPCHVSQSFDPHEGIIDCERVLFEAIWDTGATSSVITQRIIDACGLQPIGMTRVHGVHGEQETEIYLVNIYLPNGVGFHEVTVTKGHLPEGSGDMLVGMDIISSGDFSVTNTNASTVFSFRIPSLRHVDYVAEHNNSTHKPNSGHGVSKKPRKKQPKQFGKNK